MSEQQYTDSEPKFNCTNDRCGWWGAKSECKRKPGLLYCPQCGMPVTTKQQHTDSPVTGDGGVEWHYARVYNEQYRFQWDAVENEIDAVEWLDSDGDWQEEMESQMFMCLTVIYHDRQQQSQHHRQRCEARLRELLKERQAAITEAVSRAGIDPIDESYFTGQQVVIDELEAILSPDDATGEV